ncbi:hypothetical protein DVH05_000968 [Phytophthora capsici]|nr:hypothetical protein DVH05_000968 [Phytophthora capsici]
MGADDKEDASYKNRMKARCKILIDNLQPTILKAQIDRLIELERRDCKTDDVALFDLILEHAKVQQRFHRMSQDHAVRTDSKASKTDRKPPRTAGSKPPTSRPAPSAPRASGAAVTGAAASATPRAPPHDGCLVCKGSHWLNDCPTATDAQREEALRKYRDDKAKKTGATRSKTARYAVAASTVRINGLVEMPYAADTAADHSIVPQETLNSLRAM